MNIKKTIGVLLFGAPIAGFVIFLGIEAPRVLVSLVSFMMVSVIMFCGLMMIDKS